MKPRRFPMLLAFALCAVLLAACGSSSSSSTSNSTSTPASSATTSSSSSATTPKPPSLGPTEQKAAIAECKRIITAQTKLSQGAKEKLEGACSKAAKGDTAAVRKAAREVCEEVIGTSSIPSSAKEQAKAACSK